MALAFNVIFYKHYQIPVIVENADKASVDLITANSHLLHSQV